MRISRPVANALEGQALGEAIEATVPVQGCIECAGLGGVRPIKPPLSPA